MKGIVSERNANLRGRLFNWKFGSALMYLEGEDMEVVGNVRSLYRLFENCGHFEGDLGNLVRLAVLYLIGDEDPLLYGEEERK